jgi:hypothetical protein
MISPRKNRGLGDIAFETRDYEFVFGDQLDSRQAMAADLEAEFSRLVIRPALASIEIRAMASETLEVWVSSVEAGLSGVPRRHSIPPRDWSRFMIDLAAIAAGPGHRKMRRFGLRYRAVDAQDGVRRNLRDCSGSLNALGCGTGSQTRDGDRYRG